jgi:hypothetical protein
MIFTVIIALEWQQSDPQRHSAVLCRPQGSGAGAWAALGVTKVENRITVAI